MERTGSAVASGMEGAAPMVDTGGLAAMFRKFSTGLQVVRSLHSVTLQQRKCVSTIGNGVHKYCCVRTSPRALGAALHASISSGTMTGRVLFISHDCTRQRSSRSEILVPTYATKTTRLHGGSQAMAS